MMNTKIATDYMFEKLVGQEAAKSQIAHYHIHRFQRNRTFPNVLLTGSRGQGKTHLAQCIGRGLFQSEKTGNPCFKSDGKTPLPRKFLEINCSTLKTVSQFINSVLIPNLDNEVTYFLDECANIPHQVGEALLTMLNVTESNKTTFVDIQSDYVLDLDFTRTCFILATTDAQKLCNPLVNRLTRIDIEDYTLENLAEIIRRIMKGVEFEGDVLLDAARTTRSNARLCVRRAKEMQDMVVKNKFGYAQWKELKKNLNILEYGISPLELSILKILNSHPEGITLNGISARTGLSVHSIQRDYEMFLQQMNLMTITAGKGRCLTSAGQAFLKSLAV